MCLLEYRLAKAKEHDATHFDEEELINTDAEEANPGDEDELSEDEDAEEGRRPKAPRAQKKYDEVNGKLQELRAAIGSAVGDALSEPELKSAVITHEDVLKDIEVGAFNRLHDSISISRLSQMCDEELISQQQYHGIHKIMQEAMQQLYPSR